VQQSKELTVKDVMRRQVPVAAPETTIAELARLMVEHRVPGVPILENDQLVGIVTEGDLIEREAPVDFPEATTFFDAIVYVDAGESLADELRHVLATTAKDLMTAPVISIRDFATLGELATLMVQRRINPIPVVDDERRIIGLATRSGLVEAIARLESAS
jgi:CBS domain-containing protein